MPPNTSVADLEWNDAASASLSASALRWWAGAFCVFLGALFVVVPSQFTAHTYSSMEPRVALWGLAFTVAGWSLLAVAAIRLRPALQAVAHVMVATVFALLAGGLAASAAWSGTIVYSLISLAVLASAALPTRDTDATHHRGDLLSLVIGGIAVTVGLWMALFAGRVDPRVYAADPVLLRMLGLALVVTGVPLAAVQVRAVKGWMRSLVHGAAGLAVAGAGLGLSWPNRSWTGVLFYLSSGTLVAALPYLRQRLRHVDPGSLSSRLALLLAAATSVPVVLTLGFLAIGQQAVLAEGQRSQAFLLLLGVVGAALLIGFWGARGLILPLRRLAEGADLLAADEPVRNLPMTGITEMDRLSSAFSHMRGRLATRAREAEDLTGELRRRAEALADADRRKDEFLAMLAHELRNPLGAISTASHLLDQAETDDPRVARAVPVIHRQMRHLTRMVDDLLDMSRITRGKVALQRERLDLARIVEHSAELMEERAAAAGLELGSRVPADPVWVEADSTRLEQVLGNLLTNAVRYTESGGRVVVTLETRREESEAADPAAEEVAVLTVADTGIGMSEDLLERVFDLFSQGERSLERRGGGLGIGLTLVRQLVEMHGGAVEARSPGIGLGSEFEVRLPLAGNDIDRDD